MNFSQAFRYPFQNMAKVLSIVLVLSIAFAVFIGLMLNSHDWSPLLEQVNNWGHSEDVIHNEDVIVEHEAMSATPLIGMLGLIVVVIVSGFWISGYSVAVIRSIWNEIGTMPDIDFGRNLRDGFTMFLSSVAYWILFMVLLAVETIVIQATGSLGAVNALLVAAGVAVTVIALAVMGWAYFVGMARFAVEGDHRAAYQIRRNIRIARENWSKGASLLLYLIALSIVYGAIRGIVDGVFGGVMGVTGMLGITLSIVIYYIFNLMQHFSTQHMIAQYAVQVGIGDGYDPDKDKVDFA